MKGARNRCRAWGLTRKDEDDGLETHSKQPTTKCKGPVQTIQNCAKRKCSY
jgi:hypothetical protein